ncbi:MAG: glycosyltransferase [Bacteroidales bacterium]|jgi:glycosyltransferase involved in cell wall biosynthesis|nr:glycosyltransferase [Bacteroidales bacterium]
MKIVLLGTSYPYRGGLALYNERLMEQFRIEGEDVEICTFSLQYPSFLFPGQTQYSASAATHLYKIKRQVNSINPFNWILIGRKLKQQTPDIIIIKYWMTFFAPCFGTIARIARKNKRTKVIAILDNVIPHEDSFFDKPFTKYFVKNVDAFVTMSQRVYDDLAMFDSKKPRVLTPHPLFDNFGQKLSRQEALTNLIALYPQLPREDNTIRLLFFGLIREYKGLDLLIEALEREDLQSYPISLIVAGEFYDNAQSYYDRVSALGLTGKVIFTDKFIDDKDVKSYFCASDLVVLPYKDATQSGVTQIAYHFEIPMLVTDVGGLAELVPNGRSGYVCKADKDSIADSLVSFCQNKPNFNQTLREEKQKYAWSNMTKAIRDLYQKTKESNNDNKK